jgi:hypothetical protein
MSVRRAEIALAGLLAVVFGAAPTVGDIGSCGRAATALDEQTFAEARKQVDCQFCTACKLSTQTCQNACDPAAPPDVAWPATCQPLEHDGQVCLRALQASSCAEYARFVDDVAPTEPTECDFCHLLSEVEAGVGP